MRLFVAIELPDRIREGVERFVREARASLPERAVRWVPRDNLHLTLLFLGDARPAEQVAQALDEVGGRIGPVPLRAVGSGRFTSAAWIGVQGEVDALRELVVWLHDRLELPMDRPYVPHITIGRFRDPRRSRRLILPEVGEVGAFVVRELVLFSSELSSEGARHTAIHRAPLGQ